MNMIIDLFKGKALFFCKCFKYQLIDVGESQFFPQSSRITLMSIFPSKSEHESTLI